jgi:aspartate kinase
VNFLPVYGHLPGRFDPDTDLCTLDTQHGHRDGVADDEGFTHSPRENQHGLRPPFAVLAPGNVQILLVFSLSDPGPAKCATTAGEIQTTDPAPTRRLPLPPPDGVPTMRAVARHGSGMKVVKFGGSSLASAAQVRKVAEIVLADPRRRVVVVSAPGRRTLDDAKVTDLLIDLARAGLTRQGVPEALAAVMSRYREIVDGLGLPQEVAESVAHDLEGRVGADPTHEDAYVDQLKAAGEDHAARVVAAYLLKLGHECHYVSPRDAGLLLSDEPGNARVLQSSYGRLRAHLAARSGIQVFPGFFGYSEAGRVVTFPRGGSDITGAIVAAALDAEVYENFTDVDGVYVVDPRLVARPVEVEEITYREMRELSYAGFSVFHDEALEPVFHARIPVNVRNTNNSAAPGTLIVPERDARRLPIVGIAATAGFCNLYVSKYLMNREIGFGRRLLHLLEDEGVPFEHMPTGIDNMSVIMRESKFTPATEDRVLRRIRQELGVDEVTVERELALCMVVGEGMRHTIGVAGRACSAIARARVNLEMINQGSSEVSMMFGIKAVDIAPTVRALYREFFPKQDKRPRAKRRAA